MNKTLPIVINILILANLLLLSSMVLTTKRVIIIENSPNSPTNYESNRITNDNSFDFQASISALQPLTREKVITKALDEKGVRVNTIFLGIPGKGNNAPNLTDTLMVMSVDEDTEEGFLLSIPRDLFVKMPGTKVYTKINALYQRKGMDSVQTVLSEITGLDFDYKIVIDLEGVKKIIDQVGGIDIFVEKDIYDPVFPGPNNSYQLFVLKNGWQYLDGKTALKYIRTRHDPGGDFARMHRQQKVLTALKEKISSLHPIWNLAIILDIWKTVMSNFQTNLSLKNIKTFWNIIKDIDLEKIEFKVLDPTTELLVPGHTILNGQRTYILNPKAGLDNYNEIRKYINSLISL